MRILVTGAAGFVGRRVCHQLAANGHEVVGMGRGPAPADIPLTAWLQVDLCDASANLAACCRDSDAVIHLAARTHSKRQAHARDKAAYTAINVEGTRRLASAAVQAGVGRFIYMSSIKVNGEGDVRAADGHWHRYSPADEPAPRDIYGRSKLAAEQLLANMQQAAGLNVICLRPPLVYGHGARGNLARLAKLIDLGLPLPFAAIDNARSLIHVDSLARAVVACMAAEAVGFKVYTVADIDVSTPDLIETMARARGRRARLFPLPDAVLHAIDALAPGIGIARLTGTLLVDNSAAQRELQWQPDPDLESGLAHA
ncbi:MAG: NAD-dependent epimerase/dehydratase family protein [Gammaproteobacteria bacterium]|nr:NAD-dependent epimerase/dehydratase family protein [Gammaproteobacteria bacterium]